MSAQFIIEYAGQPVRFVAGQPELVDEDSATRYISEADAWLDALKYGFSPTHTEVVNFYERNLENGRSQMADGK